MSDKKHGYLYIYHGKRYENEAQISVESLRKYDKSAHVTAFTNVKPKDGIFDKYKIIKPTSIRSKVSYIDESPYAKTIFLDTDTIFCRDVKDIFDMLYHYDFCLAHDLARKRKKYSDLIKQYKEIPYAFSEVNTGVIGFSNTEKVKECFKRWKVNYSSYYKRFKGVFNGTFLKSVPYDQPSFRVSLWETKALLYILPVEYNVRSKQNREKQNIFKNDMGEEHLAERILHMHHDKDNLEDALKYCKENILPY